MFRKLHAGDWIRAEKTDGTTTVYYIDSVSTTNPDGLVLVNPRSLPSIKLKYGEHDFKTITVIGVSVRRWILWPLLGWLDLVHPVKMMPVVPTIELKFDPMP